MGNDDNDLMKRAAEYWVGGQPVKAGKLIFERLPNEYRPKWAARILRLLLEKGGVQSPLFDRVLDTVENQALWGDGHRVFSTIRAEALKLDEIQRTQGLNQDQKLRASLLTVAELVAKVTYNATTPPDEFDQDSGWWIAACLRGFVDHRWKDEGFSTAAWTVLFDQQ